MKLNPGWKQGPLPHGTYGWGGVVEVGNDPKNGFMFADFMGDKVLLTDGKKLSQNEIGYYNNSLNLPVGNVTEA